MASFFFSSFWSFLSETPISDRQSDHLFAMMPEICDNAIDDDMDGLIDLNDPDCDCQSDLDYFVPNPSFEDTICCPCTEIPGDCIGEPGRVDCIPPWINSVLPGFDFFHECDDYANRGINTSVPLPAPDGSGFFGLFTRGTGVGGEVIKEYAIACLNNTMMSGDQFELALSTGFISLPDDEVELGIFGTDNCANSNYTGGALDFGCPANDPNWVELATLTVNGNFEWVRDTLSFSVPMDINMIAIGGSCAEDLTFVGEDYHLIDRIELIRADDRDLIIDIQGADICAGIATLDIDPKPGATYQWYKDGIALVGENSTSINLPAVDPDGSYQVQIMNIRGCFLSEPFVFLQEPIINNVTTSICEGTFYQLGPDMITVAGMYIDTLPSAFNCDSIINLDLSITPTVRTPNPQNICEGESIQVGTSTYSTTGMYLDTLLSSSGCDSVIMTDLTVILHGRAAFTEVICEGDSVQIGSIIYRNSGVFFDTISATNGCDSLIQLDLTVEAAFNLTENYTICPGDVLDINGEAITMAGDYIFELISIHGCDSTIKVHVELAHSPVILPVEENGILGEELTIIPQVDIGLIDTVFWKPSTTFDLIETGEVNQTLLPLQTAYITMQSIDTFGCIWMDSVLVRVSKPYNIYIPNVFTPDFNGTNDYFRPYLGSDVRQIHKFFVINRWGDVVHQTEPVLRDLFVDKMGWGGAVSGDEANPGVYMYVLQVEFIDGVIREFSGDVTLLR